MPSPAANECTHLQSGGFMVGGCARELARSGLKTLAQESVAEIIARLRADEISVFGHPLDHGGSVKPAAEHGWGSPGQLSENHFLGIRRREGTEAEAKARAAAAAAKARGI